MKKTVFNCMLAAMCFSVVGCATITQGTQQSISFKLDPNTTVCEVLRVGDGKLGQVSYNANTIMVGKDKDDILANCSAPGYEPTSTKVVSGATGAGVTGVLLDFGITDMITGAMYRYPEQVTIVLTPEKKQATN